MPRHDLYIPIRDELADLVEEFGFELKLYRDLRYSEGGQASDALTIFTAELHLLADMLRRSPAAQQQLARHILKQRQQYLKELKQEFDA